MKKKLIIFFLVFAVIVLTFVPFINSCECTAGGKTCRGNCCWYDNGTCVCKDFGSEGCSKEV